MIRRNPFIPVKLRSKSRAMLSNGPRGMVAAGSSPSPAQHWYSLHPPLSFVFYLPPCQSLCFRAGQSLIELEYGGAFVDGDLPVFLIPFRAVVEGMKIHKRLRPRTDKTATTVGSVGSVGFVGAGLGTFSVFSKLV